VQVNPDDPAFGYNDTLSLPGVPKLGTVNLGQAEYWRWRYGDVDAPAIFPAAFPDSAMVMDADQRGITVTLSASSQPQTTAPLNPGTMVWSPGSICVVQPCRATESVPTATATADKDF
jgi:hypothetical protein